MDAARAAFAAAGALINPLCGLEDVAAFFTAAAAFAIDTPGRGALVANRMGEHFVGVRMSTLLASLLSKVSTMPIVRSLLATLPAIDGMTLITDKTACVVCGGRLSTHAAGTSVPLFAANGTKTAQIFYKKCGCCNCSHYPSYATGGVKLSSGEQVPYPGCTDARFFHITTSAIWEQSVLVDYEAQAMLSHTGFETFISEYEFKYGTLPFSADRARMSLAHGFYAWTLLRFRAELDLPPLERVKLGDAVGREGELSSLDQTLLANRTDLEGAFTRIWGAQHEGICRNPEGCVCQATDGHVKANRMVCGNKWARIMDCGPLGKLALNCTHSPLPGSRYCRTCRDAAAKSGPSLVGSTEHFDGLAKTFAPPWHSSAKCQGACCVAGDCEDDDSSNAQVTASSTQLPPAAVHRLSRAAAETNDNVSANEKDVYLVEGILEHRAATIAGQCAPSCALGAGHRACVKAKKRMFLIKWVGWDASHNQWVCEHDVGRSAITEYDEERAAVAAAQRRPQRHAGTLAAACLAASGGGTNDFVITAKDEESFKECCENNLKEFQYAQKKHRTAGILALVAGCGLFLKIDEIYGSESITQLHHFLFEAYHKNGIKKPKVLVYDDACHLKKFLLNRPNSILCRTLLRGMEIVCDRFHFPNHTSKWCKANVDPAKCTVPGFDKANTQAGEEAFAWLARSKHIFHSMNEARFLFLMLRLAHLRNTFLCKCRRG